MSINKLTMAKAKRQKSEFISEMLLTKTRPRTHTYDVVDRKKGVIVTKKSGPLTMDQILQKYGRALRVYELRRVS